MNICHHFHPEIIYEQYNCPLCDMMCELDSVTKKLDETIEAHDLALGKAEYEKTQLEGTVAALEERLQGYKDELRL